jgi:hypothetical protein
MMDLRVTISVYGRVWWGEIWMEESCSAAVLRFGGLELFVPLVCVAAADAATNNQG